MKVYVEVLGWLHDPDCLVARYRNDGQWETSGFPWCSCHMQTRASERYPSLSQEEL